MDREAEAPKRHEGEHEIADVEVRGSRVRRRHGGAVMSDEETFEVDHDEARTPEDVDRCVPMDNSSDEECEQGPHPRREETEGKVRKKGPVHRAGLADDAKLVVARAKTSRTLRSHASTRLWYPRVGLRAGTFRPNDCLRSVSYTHLTLPTKRIV